MAYAFDSASSQYLTTASAPATNEPATIYCLFNTAQSSGVYALVALQSTSNSDRCITALVNGNLQASSALGSGTNQAVNLAYSANQWNSAAGAFASASSRYIYYNGTKSTQGTDNINTSTFTTASIGARYSGSYGLPFSGNIAEAAIWNVALSDAEIASLAKGFKPTRIRPQSLVFYAPLIRTLQDTRGGLTITNNNSATVADHPRVY